MLWANVWLLKEEYQGTHSESAETQETQICLRVQQNPVWNYRPLQSLASPKSLWGLIWRSSTKSCGALELWSALSGGAEVVTLCCLLANELFQEGRNPGMAQRTLQKLLTGTTGSYHSQQKMLPGVTACNDIGWNGHQELGLLASPITEGHRPQISKRQFWKLPMELTLIIQSSRP